MAGKGPGEATLRFRDTREKMRSVLGGIGWGSTTADIGRLWGGDEELLTKDVDEKTGEVRVKGRTYKPEETISVPMKEYQPHSPYGAFGNTIAMMQEINAQRGGTGERVSPEQQAAMPMHESAGAKAAAAALQKSAEQLSTAADKLSKAPLNRTDAPSPTAPR
jgi:hypothetical protein